jgi:hypothetical protein
MKGCTQSRAARDGERDADMERDGSTQPLHKRGCALHPKQPTTTTRSRGNPPPPRCALASMGDLCTTKAYLVVELTTVSSWTVELTGALADDTLPTLLVLVQEDTKHTWPPPSNCKAERESVHLAECIASASDVDGAHCFTIRCCNGGKSDRAWTLKRTYSEFAEFREELTRGGMFRYESEAAAPHKPWFLPLRPSAFPANRIREGKQVRKCTSFAPFDTKNDLPTKSGCGRGYRQHSTKEI